MLRVINESTLVQLAHILPFFLTRLYSNWVRFFAVLLILYSRLYFSDFMESYRCAIYRANYPLSAVQWDDGDTEKSSGKSFKVWMVVGEGKLGCSTSPEKEPDKITLLQLDCWIWREREEKTKVLIESSVYRLPVVLQASVFWSPSSCERLCRDFQNSQGKTGCVEMGESNASCSVCVQF